MSIGGSGHGSSPVAASALPFGSYRELLSGYQDVSEKKKKIKKKNSFKTCSTCTAAETSVPNMMTQAVIVAAGEGEAMRRG